MDLLNNLLSRPLEQRKREFQYRFAQSVVFGLPVIALQYVGPMLGGISEERERWIGILQLLLTGWIVYVAAAGMVFEGILLVRQRFSLDLVIGLIAIGVFLYSAASVGHVVVDGTLWYPVRFYLAVILLILWTGFRWWRLARGR